MLSCLCWSQADSFYHAALFHNQDHYIPEIGCPSSATGYILICEAGPLCSACGATNSMLHCSESLSFIKRAQAKLPTFIQLSNPHKVSHTVHDLNLVTGPLVFSFCMMTIWLGCCTILYLLYKDSTLQSCCRFNKRMFQISASNTSSGNSKNSVQRLKMESQHTVCKTHTPDLCKSFLGDFALCLYKPSKIKILSNSLLQPCF